MPLSVIIMLTAEALFAFWLLLRRDILRSRGSLILGAVLIAGAFLLRGAMFGYETLDYQTFLTKWVEFYRSFGGFSALDRSVGNYNIPYLYFLALFSYSGIRDLYLIKLLSCFFDVLLAYAALLLVSRLTESRLRIAAVFFAVLYLPTVVLNGALWGQCDSIYVSLALLGVYCALEDRPVVSMIFMALSFGFKLQAVFLLPICAVLWLYRKYDLRHFLVFPAAYLALVLPAVFCGRPLRDAVMLYLDQAGSVGSGLNYNSPSVYAFFRHVSDIEAASSLGVAAAFALLFTLLAFCLKHFRRLNDERVILALLIMVIGIPFLLPHMHDRYFFAADVVSVITAAVFPEALVTAAAVQFASLLGYHAYLKMRYLLTMDYGAAALIVALAVSIFLFLRSFFKKTKNF